MLINTVGKFQLNHRSKDGDRIFNPREAHSVGEALSKSGVNALEFMGKRGLSQAVKSDFAKHKIKSVANKYLD